MRRSILLLLLIPAAGLAAGGTAVQIARTGQTACYSEEGGIIPCAGTGQDGDRQAGTAWPSPRFTDNGNGTVTDNLTGLIWLQEANCPTLNPGGWAGVDWSAAVTAARQLQNGECGLSDGSAAGDWRLPNIAELESLLDLSRSQPSLPDGHPFSHLLIGGYWSSTTVAPYPMNAVAVGMDNGCSRGDVKSAGKFVLPVRGTTPRLAQTGQKTCWDGSGRVVSCTGTGQDGELKAGGPWPWPRFTEMRDGTMRDNLTGLAWLRDVGCFGNMSSWQSALTASNGLKSGMCGLTDGSAAGQWRLPNRKELQSLGNYEEKNGSAWLASQGFLNPVEDWYWSSDTYVADSAPTARNPEKWVANLRGAGWLQSWATQVYGNRSFRLLPVRDSIPHDGIVLRTAGKTAPDMTDARKVYRSLLGLDTLTAEERIHADVAVIDENGTAVGDGSLDTGDVVLILRKANGASSW